MHGLVVVQLMTVTVTAAVITLPDGLAVPSDSSVWAAVLVTGVAATALAYFLQTWVQSQLSATCVAVVLTTEPVFAGLVAVGLASEQLSDRAALGAVLVLAGMLLAAPPSKRSRQPRRPAANPLRCPTSKAWRALACAGREAPQREVAAPPGPGYRGGVRVGVRGS